jgi:hypothetical protein
MDKGEKNRQQGVLFSHRCIDIVGPKVFDRVEVAEVDTVLVGAGAVGAVFLDVHHKEADVHTIKLLMVRERRGAEEGQWMR